MGIMELKLDIDNIALRKRAVWFLISLQKPYKIRTSSGGKGIHILKECSEECSGCSQANDCYRNCWIYQKDDKKRLELNLSRHRHNLTSNYLWDLKKGKHAGEWNWIENEQDIDRYLRQFTGYY